MASNGTIRPLGHEGSPEATSMATEQDPLLGSSVSAQRPGAKKKPWYRPRPLWLVPFAVTASLCRGMTLAPRAEVFIQLACEDVWLSRHHHRTSQHQHVQSLSPLYTDIAVPRSPVYLGADGSVPFLLNRSSAVPLSVIIEAPPQEGFRRHQSLAVNGNSSSKDGPSSGKGRPINCAADPKVQAGAANLQTIMTSTMGLLSTLTTGWWGQFGDRRGRTKVIASATAGLLFTDVMFILASNPPGLLQGHGQRLLVVAPVIEGLLGGWSSLQCATQAYISDCTSHGSRANVYSQFTGVFYVGLALGPEIAALILRSKYTTTTVFYVSSICAFVNLFLILFVFPESLNEELRTSNIRASREARSETSQHGERKWGLWRYAKATMKTFIEPLSILGPKPRQHGRGQDWSLTLLAMSLFSCFLTMGLFQIKYLYAKHVYSWDAAGLSHYITAVVTVRALHLLVILPAVIWLLKPVPHPHNRSTSKAKKVPPTPRALLSEIKFDLAVAKVSIFLDLASSVLVTLATNSSPELFVGLTMIASLGSGMVPALQSVAMCTLHLRERSGGEQVTPGKGGAEVGRLFGAFAVLQAAGSMIVGPLLFGVVYSATVGVYPKSIFVTAACLLVISVVLLLFIRPPRDVPIEIRVDRHVWVDVETPRGRSRESKDIGAGLLRGYVTLN